MNIDEFRRGLKTDPVGTLGRLRDAGLDKLSEHYEVFREEPAPGPTTPAPQSVPRQGKLGEADRVRAALLHSQVTGLIHELSLGSVPPIDRLTLTLDNDQQIVIESEKLTLRFEKE